MRNIFFTIEFIGALALFFFIASLIGHLLKLDEYMLTHDFHIGNKDRKNGKY